MMTDLTDEVLIQISEYRDESFIAEANVIRAHMEVCLRDIKIAEECEQAGIIMEGDIVPKRDGENIFKYILLFLPRLVINVLRKVASWLLSNPEIMTTEEYKKAQRKAEEEVIKQEKGNILSQARETVAARVNNHISVHYPGAKCSVSVMDGEYICSWNVKRDIILNLYMKYDEYFTKYLEVFERLNQKQDLKIDENNNQDMIEFERELNTMLHSHDEMQNAFTNIPAFPITYDETVKFMKLWDESYNAVHANIERSMKKLIALYHDMDQSTKVSPSNMRFATRYYNSIEQIFGMFTDFHTKIGKSVGALKYGYEDIPIQIKEVFEKIKNNKDEKLGNHGDILKQGGFYNGD